MTDFSAGNVAAGSLGTAVVLAFSIPALRIFYRRFGPINTTQYHPIGDVYKDEDGEATTESQKRFNTLLPRVVAFVSSILGGLVSIVDAVSRTPSSPTDRIVEEWLRVACWVLPIALIFDSIAKYHRL